MRPSQLLLHLLKETSHSVSIREQGIYTRDQASMVVLTILSFGKSPVKEYASFEWHDIYNIEIEF